MVEKENLETSVVGVITENERLVIKYKDIKIVDISRSFLDTNGIRQTQNIIVKSSEKKSPFKNSNNIDINENVIKMLKSMNVSSQRGMVEMFDSSVGRGTVLMPFGGKYQLTETEGSVHKIPTSGFTNSCSLMSFGYNPLIAEFSPYLGAQYAVIESIAKLVAMGGNYRTARLTFQEYFEKLGDKPEKWGKPFEALLGGLEAQMEFETPAIGGKDSMSGTFKDLNVPPTLISFAVCTGDVKNIISPEFKENGNYIYLIKSERKIDKMPDYENIKSNFKLVESDIKKEAIISASTVKFGGIAESVIKMSFGNKIGAKIDTDEELFALMPGDIVVESKQKLNYGIKLGNTIDDERILLNGKSFEIDNLIEIWEERYKKYIRTQQK